jgi:hypothetical protein
VNLSQSWTAVFRETVHVGPCGAGVGDYDVDEADFLLDLGGGRGERIFGCYVTLNGNDRFIRLLQLVKLGTL